MDVGMILAQLREERDQITEAIMAIERVAGTRHGRRGRPPKWLVATMSEVPAPAKRRGRPPASKNSSAAKP